MLLCPKITELFEITRDLGHIPAAIFRTDPVRGRLTPYEVPQVPGREGIADTQASLYEALLDSGGALLVQSRAGLGKTREIAELAARLCDDEGCTVCVAREEGDARLSAPTSFPEQFQGSRVLFIFDDLHRRVGSGTPGQEPYIERLEAFLAFFDRQLAPGERYVLVTARSEPQHQRQLGLNGPSPSGG